MTRRQLELQRQRQALLMRSAELRLRLDWQASDLVRSAQPVISVIDGLAAGGRWMRRNPLAILALGAVLAVRRPALAVRWLRRGLGAWRWWDLVRAFVVRR